MYISLFELFSIGVGPSSSHTVGPMAAANDFILRLKEQNKIDRVTKIRIDVFGSLALTGKGHGTDKAILNGLEGKKPETVAAEKMEPRFEEIQQTEKLRLDDQYEIHFNFETDYKEHTDLFLEKHSNGMKLTAFHMAEKLESEIYFSIGGGFIVTEANFGKAPETIQNEVPYNFNSATELLKLCEEHNLTIAELMLENERALQPIQDVREGILRIAAVMEECIEKGLTTKGILPGGLQVKRRAAELYEKLQARSGIRSIHETSDVMNWLNAYAMAVNEENAAGHRIVTAPTNGAAGVIPAVMKYYKILVPDNTEDGIINYFLTAAAIGSLYKKNASISGAEVGCQGEVGTAASMAAGGLTAALGGTLKQIENAAEIAMEHHLGMTCDPVNGLVQIPCIERNAMGAVKAVNATRMALIGDGEYKVTLDKIINTMNQTGRDMMTIYKETSLGGLAVNVPEC